MTAVCRCDWEECGRRSRSPWLPPNRRRAVRPLPSWPVRLLAVIVDDAQRLRGWRRRRVLSRRGRQLNRRVPTWAPRCARAWTCAARSARIAYCGGSAERQLGAAIQRHHDLKVIWCGDRQSAGVRWWSGVEVNLKVGPRRSGPAADASHDVLRTHVVCQSPAHLACDLAHGPCSDEVPSGCDRGWILDVNGGHLLIGGALVRLNGTNHRPSWPKLDGANDLDQAVVSLVTVADDDCHGGRVHEGVHHVGETRQIVGHIETLVVGRLGATPGLAWHPGGRAGECRPADIAQYRRREGPTLV